MGTDAPPAPRLAVLCDFREEAWPSMDLAADMLVEHLRQEFSDSVSVTPFCPPFRRSVSRVPALGAKPVARNVERLLNRMVHYPRALPRLAEKFDAFHVADHSYAQLVHKLPADVTGVFCHDLDTFNCLLQPASDPRPRWFRSMTRRIFSGLEKAAVVFYSTAAVRAQIDRQGLFGADRLVHAPYGTSWEFNARPVTPEPARQVVEGAWASPDVRFILHVGSSIPRKRIDVLLDVYAEVRQQWPDVRLLQVGGDWTEAQREQIGKLGIESSIYQCRGLSREQLASLYRTAAVVLQPSEAEGFGLPVVEALASGAVVIASDIPVLREVGGGAALYCPVADVAAWAKTVGAVLGGAATVPNRPDRLEWASKYSWKSHAGIVLDAYRRLLGRK